MVKKRLRHSAAYKLRNALEVLEEAKMVSRLSSDRETHPNTITGLEKTTAGRLAKRLCQ